MKLEWPCQDLLVSASGELQLYYYYIMLNSSILLFNNSNIKGMETLYTKLLDLILAEAQIPLIS